MGRLLLTEDHVTKAVIGSAVLGGGGGGSISGGLEIGRQSLVLGEPILVSIDDVSPDSLLLMVSTVGAAAAEGVFLKPAHYLRAVELLASETKGTLAGFITAEVGPFNVVNGWAQSAISGLPVVDAPADGRAHPTGRMGMMGLTSRADYTSIQACVGGGRERGSYIEMVVRGSPSITANAVRHASIFAGGMVAVAREPLPARFVVENGAPGSISEAMRIGEAVIGAQAKGPRAMIDAARDAIGATFVDSAIVRETQQSVSGGMDVGRVNLCGATGREYAISFADAFLTFDSGPERLATFPDLILAMDEEKGLPVAGIDLREGMRVALLCLGKGRLRLGKAYEDPGIFDDLEMRIGKEIASYYRGPSKVSRVGL